MKSKILLGTLLGGALLAACTADDALDVKQVAGGVNNAAPVFTISFNGEDDVTRALMGTDEITWEATDKMSLFHGGQINGSDDFYASGVYARNFNAVYYGSAGDAGGQRRFTTQANVNEGAAIMIYPADLTNDVENKSQNPLITIDQHQKTETKSLTPHISEVLNITQWTGNDDAHEAGYGRNYDIVMRRVGAQMRLALKAINDEKLNKVDVPAVEFKRVTVGVENVIEGKSNPFTIKSEIKIGKVRNGENLIKASELTTNQTEKDGTGIVGTNTKDHKYWAFTPWIEPAENGTVTSISTRDVENLVAPNTNDTYPTALFTLLPLDDKDETGVFDNTTEKANFSGVTVTVETSYGKIVLENAEDSKIWSDGKTDVTLDEGLQAFLKVAFSKYTAKDLDGKGALYEGQLKANKGTRYITVDMSELDMNGLHIEDEKQLENAIAVYEALKDTESDEVTFNLDGDEETGQFIIETEEGRKALAKAMSFEKLTLTPCKDDGEVCTEIVLRGNAALNVPEKLLFGNGVNVRLEGKTWTLGKSYYGNVEKVIVSEGAEVMFGSVVCALDPAETDGALAKTAPTLEIEKGGVVNMAPVSGTSYTTLQMNVENYGEINVANADLRVRDGAVLNNNIVLPEDLEEVVGKSDAPKAYTKDFVDKLHRGKITISGKFGSVAAVKNTNASVCNYGLIVLDKSNDGDPSLLLTTNGKTASKTNGANAEFDKPIAKNNIFGIVDCGAEGLNGGSDITGVKGFVKSTSGTATGVNYWLIEDGGNSIDVDKKTFVEILKAENWATIKGTCTGLVINEGLRLSVNTGTNDALTSTSASYLKGTIHEAGMYTYTKLSGYFGGDATNDVFNILDRGE